MLGPDTLLRRSAWRPVMGWRSRERSRRRELTLASIPQSAKSAKTLYNSKILELRKNLTTLQEQIERKSDNARAVGEVLRIKMSQERQKVMQAGGSAGD